jgi:hypothetical protein
MTFDITQVRYKPDEELLGEEVYYAQSLRTLEEVVTTENGVYKGCVTDVDMDNPVPFPFCINGIWVNHIYLTGKKNVLMKPKYRPFNSVDELVSRWDSINPCTRPANTMPLIWVKHKYSETVELITTFCKDGVELGGCYMDWDIFFDVMVFLDNTPCGVEIKEEVV